MFCLPTIDTTISLISGEVHIETAAALNGYRGDEEEGPFAEGGIAYSLPPLTSYYEDRSSAPHDSVVAALFSSSQV